jgi:hypothetical protein
MIWLISWIYLSAWEKMCRWKFLQAVVLWVLEEAQKRREEKEKKMDFAHVGGHCK